MEWGYGRQLGMDGRLSKIKLAFMLAHGVSLYKRCLGGLMFGMVVVGVLVKSFYSLASRRAKPFPRSTIWNSWAPRRARFFAWEATWAKILLLYAFFGPFGGREIGEPLRIVKAWTK
ncbi:hypothetical protein CK203_095797 [Vitis vinifera]|uniref:Uncharacterized protein n=1 Tax=Vitis vinifera TaxID=29760 RepID=A0A438DLC1_VITVI|nr:hypothetical protein CK203_095797 [Vitis vinifera]